MRILFALTLTLLLALTATARPEAPAPAVYDNDHWGVAFVPPKGWTVTETASSDCLFSVEAVRDQDARFQICISAPRQEILFTKNAFVACENLKQYISEVLKGLGPSCRRGKAGNLYAFDTIYQRRIQTSSGVRVQVVNHLFAPVGGGLVQVLAYALGDDEEQARARYLQNTREFDRMMSGVRFKKFSK